MHCSQNRYTPIRSPVQLPETELQSRIENLMPHSGMLASNSGSPVRLICTACTTGLNQHPRSGRDATGQTDIVLMRHCVYPPI